MINDVQTISKICKLLGYGTDEFFENIASNYELLYSVHEVADKKGINLGQPLPDNLNELIDNHINKLIKDNDYILLYTAQSLNVKKELDYNDIYVCDSCKEYDNRFNNNSFWKGYQFIIYHMKNLPGSNIGKFPIWLTDDKELAESWLKEGERELLTFAIPKKNLLATDFDMFTVNTLSEGVDERCLDTSNSEYIQYTCWYLKSEWLI